MTAAARTAAAVLLVAAAAAALGVVTLLPTAAATGRPGPALLAGAGVELVAAAAGGFAVLRRRAGTAARAGAGAAGVAVTTVALSAVALLPPPSPRTPAAPPVPGQATWTLATGSHLRYVHLAARGPVRPDPVVYLHGGPGIPDLPGAVSLLGALTADGFDVYAYEELGAGRSDRLSDPAGYGVDRDVADLEQIRERIGADRLTLVAHSYGATLAAHYLAAHPGRVERMVLLSPGALDPADTSANRATAGLGAGARVAVYAHALAPRALLGYLLLQASPAAAHAFLPDAEADVRNDRILTLAAPGLHCASAPSSTPVRGSGFYRLQYPQSRTAPARRDPRPALAGSPVPTLVVKGSCDYLSWRSARDYHAVLPDSRLVYLPGTGHNLQQDRPDAVLGSTRAFLTGRPDPVPEQPDWSRPADYQGPP